MINKFNIFANASMVLFIWLCSCPCVAVSVNKTVGAVPSVTDRSPSPSDRTGIRVTVGGKPLAHAVKSRPTFEAHADSKEDVVDILDEPSDTTSFSDLPIIEIDEDVLKGRQIVGHDELIEKELKRLLFEFGEENDKVPEIFLNEVKLYIRAYRQNPQYRKFITASLQRSVRYMPTVKKIFTNRNIPEDMAYIAFVESGFSPHAKSRAGALGMWQFMPGTARDYSLKVGKGIDERLDPARSTYAACEYFHDLIAIFGPRSFLLALAAYNAGEGKVISCLKRIDNPLEQRTFWHIRPCLAPESREYPPKIIAAAIIGNNPEVFGFPRYEMIGEAIEVAKVPEPDTGTRQVSISASVQMMGKSFRTTREVRNKPVTEERRKMSPPRRTQPKPLIYTVKKGNTLDSVAEAFHVSRDDIKRWNQLKGNHLLAGARLKVVPAAPMETLSYTVRRGDTVREIGQSFGVRPVRIVFCNGLRDGVGIRPGQTIVIYKEMKERPTIHRVQKGSNLTRIAEAFDVKARDIMRWNNLDSASVFPNQRLRIYRGLKGA